MDSRYRLTSIAFTLKSPVDPFHIIQDLERCFQRKRCVKSVKAFCGDLIVVTICGDAAISKVKEQNSVVIDNKLYNYKVVDINITSIRVEVPCGITTDDMNRLLRTYGTVLESEVICSKSTYANRGDTYVYYGIIEMKRDIPSRLKCKYGYVNAVEIA